MPADALTCVRCGSDDDVRPLNDHHGLGASTLPALTAGDYACHSCAQEAAKAHAESCTHEPTGVGTLDDLLLWMREHPGADCMDRLPTFGGPDLDGAVGPTWSWDEHRALVGSTAAELAIVPRSTEYLREA